MERGLERPPLWAVIVMVVGGVLLVVGGVFAISHRPTEPLSQAELAHVDAAASAAAAKEAAAAAASLVPVPRPSGGPLSVLFAGDSITHGAYVSAEAAAFPALVLTSLEAGGPTAQRTVGHAGQTASEALAEGPADPADLIFVEYGTNDVDKSTVEQFTQDYPALLDQFLAASPGATLICAGPWGTADKVAPFDAIVQPACEARGGTFVSLSGLYADRGLHSEIGGPALAGGTALDDFHPNDAGHFSIAAALLAPFGLTPAAA